jgi:hypothetical protein
MLTPRAYTPWCCVGVSLAEMARTAPMLARQADARGHIDTESSDGDVALLHHSSAWDAQ